MTLAPLIFYWTITRIQPDPFCDSPLYCGGGVCGPSETRSYVVGLQMTHMKMGVISIKIENVCHAF